MDYPQSDHFDGNCFHNLDGSEDDPRTLLDLLKWRFFDKPKPWNKIEKYKTQPKLPPYVQENEVYVTFINHETELIQLHNLNILTDPVFSLRTSPITWAGPKRVNLPGISIKELPKINIIVISHNHYDHLDLVSLKELVLKDNPLIIVPLKNAATLQNQGITKIIELDWWQNHTVNEEQSITLVPAHHWSKRGLFDKNKTLWGSYIIHSHALKIFFGGDTGYSNHFKLIQAKMGNCDVTILPIASYEPRWFMKPHHINPEEAVIAHQELGSQLSIGMGYGTFQLANESFDQPLIDLKIALAKHGLKEEVFLTPINGETLFFKK